MKPRSLLAALLLGCLVGIQCEQESNSNDDQRGPLIEEITTQQTIRRYLPRQQEAVKQARPASMQAHALHRQQQSQAQNAREPAWLSTTSYDGGRSKQPSLYAAPVVTAAPAQVINPAPIIAAAPIIATAPQQQPTDPVTAPQQEPVAATKQPAPARAAAHTHIAPKQAHTAHPKHRWHKRHVPMTFSYSTMGFKPVYVKDPYEDEVDREDDVFDPTLDPYNLGEQSKKDDKKDWWGNGRDSWWQHSPERAF